MSGFIFDTFLCYQFLKRLTTPFDQWDAFKQGVIDKDGNILIKAAAYKTQTQADSFRNFDLMVLKLKHLIEKVPFGKARISSYIAALWFLREWNEDAPEDKLLESFRPYLQAMMLSEDGEAPTNNVGGGNIAGAAGDPPVAKKTQRKITDGQKTGVGFKEFVIGRRKNA